MSKYQFDYVPTEAREGDNQLYRGSVKIEEPDVLQRLEYMSELEMDKTGKVDKKKLEKHWKSLIPVLKKAKNHILQVDLVRLSDEKRYSCYDDLSHDMSCTNMLIEISSVVLNGVQPSKNS